MANQNAQTTVIDKDVSAANKTASPDVASTINGATTQEVFDIIGIHLGNTNICVSYAIRD